MSFSERFDHLFFGEGSLVRLAVFRIVVLLAALYAVWVFRIGVFQHATAGEAAALVDRHWSPIFVFDVARIGPPSLTTVRVVFGVLLGAIAAGLLGLFTRVACATTAVLATWWIAVHYSFGKPHHDCIALTFALWALPFGPIGARLSLENLVRRGGRPTAAPFAKFPIRIAQLSAVLGYFFAGASKLAIGGIEWLNGYSLQAAMLHFHAPWTAFFTSDPRLCQLMSIQIVFVQATFLLAFVPRLRWFYVPMAVFFHLMSWMTMDTGPYLTLWFVVLAAFVPWDRVPGFLGAGGAAWSTFKRVAALALASWFLWIFLMQAPAGSEFFLLGLGMVLFARGIWERRKASPVPAATS